MPNVLRAERSAASGGDSADWPARRCQKSQARRESSWPDAHPTDAFWCGAFSDVEPSALHVQRLQSVLSMVHAYRASSVADLGCGDGSLVRQLLATPRITRVIAVDRDLRAMARLERSMDPAWIDSGRLTLVHGSFAAAQPSLEGIEAVTMVETIEHLDPQELSALEHRVFGVVRPALAVITTPNVECNDLLGVPTGRFRESGHRFEWSRARFRAWAAGIALRRGYALRTGGIGPDDPACGCPTQWACLERLDRPRAGIGQAARESSGTGDRPAEGISTT